MKVQLLFNSQAGKLCISCPCTGCLRAASTHIANVREWLQTYSAVAILVSTVIEIAIHSQIQIQSAGKGGSATRLASHWASQPSGRYSGPCSNFYFCFCIYHTLKHLLFTFALCRESQASIKLCLSKNLIMSRRVRMTPFP